MVLYIKNHLMSIYELNWVTVYRAMSSAQGVIHCLLLSSNNTGGNVSWYKYDVNIQFWKLLYIYVSLCYFPNSQVPPRLPIHYNKI